MENAAGRHEMQPGHTDEIKRKKLGRACDRRCRNGDVINLAGALKALHFDLETVVPGADQVNAVESEWRFTRYIGGPRRDVEGDVGAETTPCG